MPAAVLNIKDFLEAAKQHPVLDVRSPGEYRHAHIPRAQNLPLFSDEERATIGTAYKQESREQAIKIGLDAFGPKMRVMVEMAERICAAANTRRILVHCWRGGMRSAAVAWLLDLYGFDVCLLEGGYKAYRQWVVAHWTMSTRFKILAGNTGSGKTDMLHRLQANGAPALDLEALANHRGSAFGAHVNVAQPTQEMFENLLAERLHELGNQFPGEAIWIEDESQRIGDLNIPHALFRRFSDMPAVFIHLPFEDRLERIVNEYKSYPAEKLVNSIIRIRKRLGPLETKTAIAALVENDIESCFRILLRYYDKHYYPTGVAGMPSLELTGMDAADAAVTLLKLSL